MTQTFFSALALLAASATAKTTFYLSPSAGEMVPPISIDAAEANQVLSHHLDVAHRGIASARDQIWDHLLNQKDSVERIFDGAEEDKNRLLVLMHGVSEDGIVPSDISATHEMSISPSSHFFDALLHSYIKDMQQTLHLSDSAFSHLGSHFVHGFDLLEDAASWLMCGEAKTTGSKWWGELEHLVSEKQSDAFDALQAELEAVHGLLERIQSEKHDHLIFQPLRFQSLANVKSAYGANSPEFNQVKQLVKNALSELTEAFKTRSAQQNREPSIAFVLDDSYQPSLSKRSLLDPFVNRQTNPLKLGKLTGVCYKDQTSFEKATNNCSGHGKAKQSSRGGQKCWRCECSPTKSKGSKTYWAGAACEKKDVSNQFVLLAGTGLVLVLVSLGSVYVLYNAGQDELPGTLAGVNINLK